jgi:hypothetical protein
MARAERLRRSTGTASSISPIMTKESTLQKRSLL